MLRLYLQASPLSVNSLKLNNLQSKLLYLSLSINNHFSHKAFPFPFDFTFGSSWNLLVSAVCKICFNRCAQACLTISVCKQIIPWILASLGKPENVKKKHHSTSFSLSLILNQTECQQLEFSRELKDWHLQWENVF